jgi:2-amino-4-hydroxy-6-hydroxymethyldihydropteridine diphosphokinase
MSRRLAEGMKGDVERVGRPPVEAVVALGANLGDRDATLTAAIAEIRRLPLVDDVRVSQAVESIAVKPEGPDASAPTYLNAVALVTTRLAPSVLLGYLHAIEDRHGRQRRERWGDRTLDLDLIAFGDVRSTDPRLEVPHPRAVDRDFVLAPWLALDPDAELPGAGRVDALLEQLRAAQ